MGLRTKILSGFAILTAMLFIAGVWSIYELRFVGSSVQKMLDDNYKSIHAAKMMIEALERQDSAVLLLLLGKWEEGRSIIRSGDELFRQGFEIARHNVTISGEQGYVDVIEAKYKIYKDLWSRPIVGTKREADLNWYFEEIHQAFLNTKAAVTALMELNDKNMYQTASDLKGRSQRASMPGLVAILSALIFTLVFNYFVNLYVVSPIIKITKGIRKFIETREPVNIEVETKDELADLVSSIQDMIARLMR
jgi:methyl-accepting chemotaxis protein